MGYYVNLLMETEIKNNNLVACMKGMTSNNQLFLYTKLNKYFNYRAAYQIGQLIMSLREFTLDTQHCYVQIHCNLKGKYLVLIVTDLLTWNCTQPLCLSFPFSFVWIYWIQCRKEYYDFHCNYKLLMLFGNQIYFHLNAVVY